LLSAGDLPSSSAAGAAARHGCQPSPPPCIARGSPPPPDRLWMVQIKSGACPFSRSTVDQWTAVHCPRPASCLRQQPANQSPSCGATSAPLPPSAAFLQKKPPQFLKSQNTLPPPKPLAVRSWFSWFSPCPLRFFQPAVQPYSFAL
jgi:hypothetical protein